VERIDTVVIGGGQAGLATSYVLAERRRPHVVLERSRIAESWRTHRWDSFTLVGPNWTCTLPGRSYAGPDPDGYMRREELIAFFDSYARSFDAPVREGTAVHRLSRGAGGGFVVEADRGTFAATHVVVATGPYQRPKTPSTANAIDGRVMQLHTDEYRNPAQLPAGAVVVVGSGQSGCQIAEELREAGRTVYLSTGGCGWFPRRHRGKDNVWWRDRMGFFERTVDTLPSAADRMASVPIQTGKDGGYDINLRTLAARGVILAGRFVRAERTRLLFAPDLEANLKRSDDVARSLVAEIDEFVSRSGIAAPPEDRELFTKPYVARVDQVDLVRDGVSAVIWATGYTLDFGWVDIPVFDEYGYPVQRRGVTDVPGLYFIGLHWMHTRKSGLIWGVGDDARHIVGHLASLQGSIASTTGHAASGAEFR
jgi:putative flavoprotein involved in K+ transport